MEFWDLGLRLEASGMAKRLGWKGTGVLIPWEGKEKLEKFRKSAGKDVSVGVIIEASSQSVLKKEIIRARPLAELIAVEGGELEINRAASERPEVDILLNPWKGRKDSGLDKVMARLLKKNGVSVMFSLNEILYLSKKGRVEKLSTMMAAAKMLRMFKVPFLLSSGAVQEFDMRAPSDLISFGRVLGFTDPEIKRGLSGDIVNENRKRLSGKWIMPGVELE